MCKIKIKKFTSRMLGSNEYIIYQGNNAVIIDPCCEVDIIKKFCNEKNLKVSKIVLTHAHIDHIFFIDEHKTTFNALSAIHRDDSDSLINPISNGSGLFGIEKSFGKADILLINGDKIELENKEIEVLSTPGHTPGSICLFIDEILFSGDTLFYLSVGRTDLGRGDQGMLLDSINGKLFKLPGETIVYPGHGTFTTIKYEKENNPYIY